jgi:uncharacterized membrane protein YdjX (TVP38/TMEM64 family)
MIAAAEHGLRIMAMLYLTPILPLGPVSYMCGTTSMALSNFLMAKIASLPLMLLYAFIGASAGALVGKSGKDGGPAGDELKDIEQNQTLIVSGILMSFVMIACITHYIKKELNTVRRGVILLLEHFTTIRLSLSLLLTHAPFLH